MTIGNMPTDRGAAIEGKTYWRLAIGRNADPSRFFEGGWRAFEFVVFRPFRDTGERGAVLPYRFKIAFAYWLPFYKI